jgi:hypothetical protein
MNISITPTPAKILSTRRAMVQTLSISLNELSAHSEKATDHEADKDCLESKLLQLVTMGNLCNHNIARGRVNV